MVACPRNQKYITTSDTYMPPKGGFLRWCFARVRLMSGLRVIFSLTSDCPSLTHTTLFRGDETVMGSPWHIQPQEKFEITGGSIWCAELGDRALSIIWCPLTLVRKGGKRSFALIAKLTNEFPKPAFQTQVSSDNAPCRVAPSSKCHCQFEWYPALFLRISCANFAPNRSTQYRTVS